MSPFSVQGTWRQQHGAGRHRSTSLRYRPDCHCTDLGIERENVTLTFNTLGRLKSTSRFLSSIRWKRSMRYIWQLVKNSLRMQFTYRTALFAGLQTNLFFGFLRAAVMLALYKGQARVNGFMDAFSVMGSYK